MTAKAVRPRLLFLGILLALLGWMSAAPNRAEAQACSPAAGNNLVYGKCSSTLTSQFGSTAYVDVSAATTSANGDICGRIFTVLTSGIAAGTVVDARGLAPGICSSNPFWISTTMPPSTTGPAIVLLPAGTINVCTAWTVPDQTQVIGEGPGITILQAGSGTCTGFADPFVYSGGSGGVVNPAVIHMGQPTTSTLTGKIVFEVRLLHLTVDGNREKVSSTYIDGIDNNNAEEQSTVDDVTIQNVLGNGLYLSDDPNGPGDGAADHSGPYTNIVFQQTGGQSAVSGTVCVNIASVSTSLSAQPRGIHGISCLGDSSSTASTAIVLNGNSATIKDARIDGFATGIDVGPASDGTQADLLFNIMGTDNIGAVTDLITIESGSGTAPINVAIMGVSLTPKATTIHDLTTTSSITDQYVGMYLLGAPLGSSITDGYSRLTTSTNSATWIVGYNASAAISGTCPSNGSLFSSTAGGANGTLWACIAGSWTLLK